jgi:NCAIR mutase (PurE)-related protein
VSRTKGAKAHRSRQPAEPEALLADFLARGSEALRFATVDHDRARRTGAPEVIYAAGKSGAQVVAIAKRVHARSGRCLVTRADETTRAALVRAFPGARASDLARTVFVGRAPAAVGRVCVASAGTSDLPVAEEAVETLRALGSRVERIVDVGVAGLHRLLAQSTAVRRANAIVVVAGMEGALASVVGGLTDRPVFAVPTSVGYGASFRGLAALLAMLNSCAPGVAVLNIDNGFGAAFAAHRVNALVARPARSGATRAVRASRAAQGGRAAASANGPRRNGSRR